MKILKILLPVLLVGGWYAQQSVSDFDVIPEEVYATRDSSRFKELFETPYKKIIWFGANCPVSAQRKKVIDAALKYKNLDDYYVHRPFLQNSMNIRCSSEECLDIFLMDKCSSGMCIILPNERKIIHTTFEYVVRDAEKYKNL